MQKADSKQHALNIRHRTADSEQQVVYISKYQQQRAVAKGKQKIANGRQQTADTIQKKGISTVSTV
jgi:hypothetical protein